MVKEEAKHNDSKGTLTWMISVLFLEKKHLKIQSAMDVPVFHTVCWAFFLFCICFCIAASAFGRVTKEQVGVFFPHIFNQSVSVYICICIERRDAECQRWDFEKHSAFPFFFFPDGNEGGWLEGWIKAGRWLNSETRRSSSSLPRALVFLLSSCGPHLHPGVQQSQWSPGGELVSGLGRMERVPEG